MGKKMDHQLTLGEQVKIARKLKKLSQVEFADKCNLNIRTIQRIENNEVKPRLFTLRIIEEVLDIELFTKFDDDTESEELQKLRNVFEKRKQTRMFTFIAAIFLLVTTLFLILSGIPKHIWAPFIYLLFFADFIVIGISWRCPGCNCLLGDVFNIKYCSKCGLKFYD
ncbi:MAG: hypothetical protein C0598_09145 [Marinilabiliales bacterium]|nr:MAG: hypothetical protein C0598_09145 [Marinilabiliales bacterium]